MLEHQNEHFVGYFLKIHTSQYQNRRFLGVDLKIDVSCEASVDFRHLSQNATRAHEICTLSPLRAALAIRFAESTQHDTSQVLRLPRKMTSEVSKVLRLPRKMQCIFSKPR